MTLLDAGHVVRSGVPALLRDVPVDPDAETARRWLLEELARPEYRTSPSLLERFLAWLDGLFADGPVLGLDPLVAAIVAVVLVLVVGGIAYYVAGPVRLARRRKDGRAVLAADDERSADEIRAAADAAAGAGDWATAVVERFRAIVRSLEERVVLDPRPGRTAHEAATSAGERLPELEGDLADGARAFDDVLYGKVAVGSERDAFLRELDARALAARPVTAPALAAVAAGAGAPAPDATAPGATTGRTSTTDGTTDGGPR